MTTKTKGIVLGALAAWAIIFIVNRVLLSRLTKGELAPCVSNEPELTA